MEGLNLGGIYLERDDSDGRQTGWHTIVRDISHCFQWNWASSSNVDGHIAVQRLSYKPSLHPYRVNGNHSSVWSNYPQVLKPKKRFPIGNCHKDTNHDGAELVNESSQLKRYCCNSDLSRTQWSKEKGTTYSSTSSMHSSHSSCLLMPLAYDTCCQKNNPKLAKWVCRETLGYICILWTWSI